MTAGRTTATQSREWCTPEKYVRTVLEFFGGPPALDPCGSEHSIMPAGRTYKLPHDDGLVESWRFETIFVNPPYGRDAASGTTIKDWLARCSGAAGNGSDVLALVPVATNTSHWKKYVWADASAIAFLYDTRLKFRVVGNLADKGAPMSCCMIYWGHRMGEFRRVFADHGAVVDIRACVTPDAPLFPADRGRSDGWPGSARRKLPPVGGVRSGRPRVG